MFILQPFGPPKVSLVSWLWSPRSLIWKTGAASASSTQDQNWQKQLKLDWNCISLPSIFKPSKRQIALNSPCRSVGRTVSPLIFLLHIEWLSPNTDQVPPCTIQYHPLVTQYHHVPTSTTLYCPGTIKYQRLPLSWTNIDKRQTMSYHKRQTKTYDKQLQTTNND